MRPTEMITALETLYRAKRPGFVQGNPGVGKSQTFRQLADKLGVSFLDLRVSMFDRVDLSGVPYVVDGRTRWALPDFWPSDGAGVLLLDEFNAAPREMQPVCYQLFLERRLGEYHLPDGWVPFAAGNLETDRAITVKTSTAFNNRVWHGLYETHLDDWCLWAATHDILPQVIAFVRFRPALLHAFEPNNVEKAFPSPRSWEFISDIIKAKPCPSVEHELFRGTIGSGAAAELSGFLRVWRKLPSLDAILLNPATASLPTDDNATLFAIAAGLARRSTEQNFDRVMTYAERMPKEWQTYLVKDATRRDDSLQSTTSFIQWISANSDLLG